MLTNSNYFDDAVDGDREGSVSLSTIILGIL